jgi:hypothetical protein
MPACTGLLEIVRARVWARGVRRTRTRRQSSLTRRPACARRRRGVVHWGNPPAITCTGGRAMVPFTRFFATRLRRLAWRPARATDARSAHSLGVRSASAEAWARLERALHRAVRSGGGDACARTGPGERAARADPHRPAGAGRCRPHPCRVRRGACRGQRGHPRRAGGGRRAGAFGLSLTGGGALSRRRSCGPTGLEVRLTAPREETFHPPPRIQPRDVIDVAFASCRLPIAWSRATWIPRYRPLPWTHRRLGRRHLRRRPRRCASSREWSHRPVTSPARRHHRSGRS